MFYFKECLGLVVVCRHLEVKGGSSQNDVTMCRRYCWALLISWKYMVASSSLFLPDSAGTFLSGWYFHASSMYLHLTCFSETLSLRVNPSILRPVQLLAPICAPIRAYVVLNTNSVVEVIRRHRCTLDQNYHQTVSRIRARIRAKQ